MKRGLVVGKFYPFHSGHAYLIETAAKQSDQLTVLVCDRSDQVFSGEERARWIKEFFPTVEVRVMRDIFDDDNSERWAKYTKAFLGYRPDLVFTSEDYGDAYAKYLGATHVLVNRARNIVPISGTLVRQNPFEHWQFLSAAVRSRLARRVALVGAESTGTTTMAKALATHFSTVWVPEFGRFYSEGKWPSKTAWKTEEFIFIAEEQNRIEDYYARLANKLLICDTNAWATRLWHERYIGTLDRGVEARSKGRQYDLVLLTDCDIPFVQDGLRDGEHIRVSMHKRFQTVLEQEGIPYILLSGSHEKRLKEAVSACEKLLSSGEDVFDRFPPEVSVSQVLH